MLARKLMAAADKFPAILSYSALSLSATTSPYSGTLGKPAGVQQGDVLVLLAVGFSASAVAGTWMTLPSGWTQSLNTYSRSAFYKVAGASEPSTYTFQANAAWSGYLVALRGAAFDVSLGISASASDPVTLPSVAVTPGSLLLACGTQTYYASLTISSDTGTLIARDNDANVLSSALYYYENPGASSPTFTFSNDTTTNTIRAHGVSFKPG